MSMLSVLAFVLAPVAARPRAAELERENAGLKIDLADARRDLDRLREDNAALRRENAVQAHALRVERDLNRALDQHRAGTIPYRAPNAEMMGLLEACRRPPTLSDEAVEAARLITERMQHAQAQSQAAMQQAYSNAVQFGQGMAQINAQGLAQSQAFAGINSEGLWCNCVPSRAQVWATNGPVLGD